MRGVLKATAGFTVLFLFTLGHSSSVDAAACQQFQVPDTFVDGPSGPTASSTATFTLGASCSPVTFECSLDYGLFTTCTNPKSYSGFAHGSSHNFRVRARNGGNIDATPASLSWFVDLVPPDTIMLFPPASPTTNGTLVFTFSATETVQRFDCSFDAAAWAPCSSPKSILASEGLHEFRVRAVDPAGNIDATPSSAQVLVNAIPPDTTITSAPPSPTTDNTMVFSFTASEPVLRFDCSLDAAVWTPCSSPASMLASDGLHEFRVRAVDQAETLDATPAVAHVLVNAEPCQ